MGLLDSLKDKAGSAIDTVAKMAASDTKVSEMEHLRRKAESLEREMGLLSDVCEDRKKVIEEKDGELEVLWGVVSELESDVSRQNDLIAKYRLQLSKIRASMLDIVREYLDGDTEASTYESVYNLVAPSLDDGGFVRLMIAQRMIPENVYSYFTAEDNMGKFKELDGDGLLHWLELTKYGKIKWNPHDSYEIPDSHKLNTNDKSYSEYRNRLHKRILEEFLFSIQISIDGIGKQ